MSEVTLPYRRYHSLDIILPLVSDALPIFYSRCSSLSLQRDLHTPSLFLLNSALAASMSARSKQKVPRPRSHTPSRNQRAHGSNRSSATVQKSEILINVYDLLPVRLAFNLTILYAETSRESQARLPPPSGSSVAPSSIPGSS